MRRLITITLLLLSCNCFAQNAQKQEEIDIKSYEQFQNKQFKELKQTLKDALAQNIDFYYLRLRAGILAYNNKKYEYAIPQFKKALEFAPMDTVAKEYLYYAYLFTSRKEAANDFASKQDMEFQNKVGYKKKAFDFIGVDGGVVYTNNINSSKGKTFKADNLPGKAERSLNGNLYFGELFFQNTIKNRLHINNSFSVFNTNALYETQLTLPSSETVINSQNFNNLNFQYNLGFSYITKKEWAIAASFGYYRVKGNSFTAFAPDTVQNTIPLGRDTFTINSFLGSVTIAKRFRNVQPYIQVSGSNLNALKQVQAEFGLLYFPLGNYNFYGITAGAYLRNGSSNQYVISQRIGFKILKCWWSELNFNYGNLSNYIANNGFATYNTSDAIKLQTGLDFNFYIKKHFQLGINYTFQQREKTTQQYKRDMLTNANIITNLSENYFTHLFKTTLLWKF